MAIKDRISAESLDNPAQSGHRSSSLGEVDRVGVEGVQADVEALQHLVGSLIDRRFDVLSCNVRRSDLTSDPRSRHLVCLLYTSDAADDVYQV